MSIEYKGIKYELFRDISESDKVFNERIKFINFVNSNNEINKTVDWKNAVKYSKIHINIKYLECKYPQFVYQRVKKISNLLSKD
jgi:hypothetical protein